MKRYRVYCAEDERDALPEGLAIEERYPSFVIVSADDDTIEAVRRRFPVEELESTYADSPAASVSPGGDITFGAAANTGRTRDVVVRFRSPVRPSWLERLQELGAEVQYPLGDSAVVVEGKNQKVIDAIANLSMVEQVEAHTPEISLSPEFVSALSAQATDETVEHAAAALAADEAPLPPSTAPSVPGSVVATFLSEKDRDRAKRSLSRAKAGDVYDAGPTALIVNLMAAGDRATALAAVASQPGLRKLEEQKMRNLLNNAARLVIGHGVVAGNPGGLGLSGAGEIVCVADTGLDTGNPATIHADFKNRIDNIRSFPIAPSHASLVTNPGGDDGPSDRFSCHGTHVTGSVLGNGARTKTLNLPLIQGMAPEARLVFQAIEQTPKWTSQAQLWFLQHNQQPPVSTLFGIPDNLGNLFQAAFDRGARIHSNSWGGGDPGAYDVQCEQLDRFVWEHREFLVVVAAGNDGHQTPMSGMAIASGSVSSPGTAKNCLTVGASENNRPGEFPTDTYGAWWPDDFPSAPIKNDQMTDATDDVVAFSSRGPCTTGRRKPDLIAPGTFILSTRSSQIPANNFAWGAFPPAKKDYMFMGGTSMATPLVAGAAALVRQFLRTRRNIPKPSAALLKAALIHASQYHLYRFAAPDSARFADNEQGWGRLDLESLLAPAAPARAIFVDENQRLRTGQSTTIRVSVTNTTVPLRVTMAYSDFPGERLVNNLNLFVRAPSGAFFVGNDFADTKTPDRVNNVEGVVVPVPEAGTWTVQVVASEVLRLQQPFSLVVTGGGAALA